MYGIGNIRDLFGSKMQINAVKNNPICRLGMINSGDGEGDGPPDRVEGDATERGRRCSGGEPKARRGGSATVAV